MIKKCLRWIAGSAVCLYLVCTAFLVVSVNAENPSEGVAQVVQVADAPDAVAETDASIVDDALASQPKWMQLVVNIIAFAAVIGSVIPQTSERANVVLKGLRWLIDIGALNILNAKNAKPKDKYSDIL